MKTKASQNAHRGSDFRDFLAGEGILPAVAKPTDDVFHARLRQIASAADRIGLGHELFPQPASKSDH